MNAKLAIEADPIEFLAPIVDRLGAAGVLLRIASGEEFRKDYARDFEILCTERTTLRDHVLRAFYSVECLTANRVVAKIVCDFDYSREPEL